MTFNGLNAKPPVNLFLFQSVNEGLGYRTAQWLTDILFNLGGNESFFSRHD